MLDLYKWCCCSTSVEGPEAKTTETQILEVLGQWLYHEFAGPARFGRLTVAKRTHPACFHFCHVYQKKQEDNMSSSYPNTQYRQQQKRNTQWFPLSLWGCSSSSHHVLLFLAVSLLASCFFCLLWVRNLQCCPMNPKSLRCFALAQPIGSPLMPWNWDQVIITIWYNVIHVTSQMVVVVYSFPSAITSPLAKVNMETSWIWTEVSKAHPDQFGCPRQRPYSLEASRWRQRSGEKIFENRIQYERYTAMQSGACSSF